MEINDDIDIGLKYDSDNAEYYKRQLDSVYVEYFGLLKKYRRVKRKYKNSVCESKGECDHNNRSMSVAVTKDKILAPQTPPMTRERECNDPIVSSPIIFKRK